MNIKKTLLLKKEKLTSLGYRFQHNNKSEYYNEKRIVLKEGSSIGIEDVQKALYITTLKEKWSEEIRYIGFRYFDKKKNDSFDYDVNDSLIVSAEVGLEKLDQVIDFLSIERQAEEIDSFMGSFIEEINKEFSNEESKEFYKVKKLLSLPSSEVVRLGEFDTVLKWSKKIMVEKNLKWITLCSEKEKNIMITYVMLEKATSGELGRR